MCVFVCVFKRTTVGVLPIDLVSPSFYIGNRNSVCAVWNASTGGDVCQCSLVACRYVSTSVWVMHAMNVSTV